MSSIERRYTLVPVEVRVHGERRSIGGYAAKFNRMSQNLGGFVERVAPTFFNKSRGDGWPDVLARYNHDDNMLLGTTGGGTLRLSVDDTGLLYEVDPPAARADVVELVERGDVRKSSFAFRVGPDGDEWGLTDQGYPMRTLLSGPLVDVAPVNLPAYMDSSVGMRGIDAALASLASTMEADVEEVRKLAEEDELRQFFVRTDQPAAKRAVYGTAAVMELKRKQAPLL
jgi:HK97 family phage prohead protease